MKSTTTGALRKLGFRKPAYHKDPTWFDLFTRPVAMFAYPTVLLPSIWFSVAAMTEVANTAGFPLNFGEHTRWHFNTRSVGFCSFSGFIGALVGEIFAGPLCDFIAGRALAKKRAWVPEKILPVTFIALVTIPVSPVTLQALRQYLCRTLLTNFLTGWFAALRARAGVPNQLGGCIDWRRHLCFRPRSRIDGYYDVSGRLLPATRLGMLGRLPILEEPHGIPPAVLCSSMDRIGWWSQSALHCLCLSRCRTLPVRCWNAPVDGPEPERQGTHVFVFPQAVKKRMMVYSRKKTPRHLGRERARRMSTVVERSL